MGRGYIAVALRRTMSANQYDYYSLQQILENAKSTGDYREIKTLPSEVKFKIIDAGDLKSLPYDYDEEILNENEKRELVEYLFKSPSSNNENEIRRPLLTKVEDVSNFLPNGFYHNYEQTKHFANENLRYAISNVVNGAYYNDKFIFTQNNLENAIVREVYKKHPELAVTERVYIYNDNDKIQKVIPKKIGNSWLNTINHVAEDFNYDNVVENVWNNYQKQNKLSQTYKGFLSDKPDLKYMNIKPEIVKEDNPVGNPRFKDGKGY